MNFNEDEFERAEEELESVLEDPSVLEENYHNVSDEKSRVPDQLIWQYIYKNVGGSLRRALTDSPPETFPVWLKELFAKEYSNPDEDFPVDELIQKALERLVQRRLTA